MLESAGAPLLDIGKTRNGEIGNEKQEMRKRVEMGNGARKWEYTLLI